MFTREKYISIGKMASTEGLSQDEKDMRKTLFSMAEMVKVLYEDYLERKRSVQEKASKNNKRKEELKEFPSTPFQKTSLRYAVEVIHQFHIVPIKMVLVHLKNIQEV
jgi:hypothetical protein